MSAMGLGWVIVMPEGNAPLLMNKSGALQGEYSFVVMAPSRNIAVFASMNSFNVSGIPLLVQAANNLVTELEPR